MVRIANAERIIPVLPKRYSGILKVATFLLFFAGIIAAVSPFFLFLQQTIKKEIVP